MTGRMKHVMLKGTKIALGCTLAIVMAEVLQLRYAVSAGTVALLTLLTTKKGTVQLIVYRLLSFGLTSVLGLFFFRLIPNALLAFVISLGIVSCVLAALKWESALSVNALILIHFLSELDLTMAFVLNEFLLVLIGVLIAFVLNLIHRYSVYEDDLHRAMNQIDEKMRELLSQIVTYIEHPGSHSSSWGELVELQKQIQKEMTHAMEYDENVFSQKSQVYLDYFEMREFQCEILHLLHYEIRKIRSMPKQASVLSAFIQELIPLIHAGNDPEKEIEKLKLRLDEIKKGELPQTQEEFENRAQLYHILMDMEEFLLREKQFVKLHPEMKN